MLRKAVGLCLWFLLVMPLAAAQDFNRFDLSFGFGGQFSKTSQSFGDVVTLKPTSSGVGLFSARFRFSPRHAVAFNVGHTSNAQVYQIPPDTFRVQAGITDYSFTYSFSFFQTRRMEPFLFAGAGAVRFSPDKTYVDGFPADFGASDQSKLAFPYGAAVDYRVWKALAVRLQYRGLVFKAPDFGRSALVTRDTGHMAEPSVGIVLKF